VSELNQKIYAQIEEWRQRRIEKRFVTCTWTGLAEAKLGGEVRNVSVLVAIGVTRKASATCWRERRHERRRCELDRVSARAETAWLEGCNCLSAISAWADRESAEFYPEPLATLRGSLLPKRVTKVPSGKVKEVAAMLKRFTRKRTGMQHARKPAGD